MQGVQLLPNMKIVELRAMDKMKKIWFDFTNPPHVNLYHPLINYFLEKAYSISCTARDFVETTSLLEQKGIDYKLFGKHGGKNRLRKAMNLGSRLMKLTANVHDFDVSISSNYEAPLVSWMKRKKSIVFDDNDISPNWLYAKFANYVISPSAINQSAMYNMGIKKDQLICYNGFKEDIYIASYTPDKNFLNQLPFDEFVTVRPENIQASYVPNGVQSIVPELFEKLGKKGMNVLYLPRYIKDRDFALGMDHVFIPNQPLNGLDVCYYSKAVLTGAGTFSREAALMGKVAVSFFAGEKFLSVDEELFRQEKIFFSRDPAAIVDYIAKADSNRYDLSRSKKVQMEVLGILEKIIE